MDLSEEEQVEALKKWWKANGIAIIVGVLIGLAVVFSWRYWNAHRLSLAEQTSGQYDALNQALKGVDKQKIRQQGERLQADYPNSFYAVLAAFSLARLALEEGDSGAAVRHLQWALERAKQDAIKDIARLRLARVLLAEKRWDEVQVYLDQVGSKSFAAELEELKGDLYLVRNELTKARAAYQAALAASSGNTLLQMKLDNLPPSAVSQ